MSDEFASAARSLGFELDDEALERFDIYRERILSAGFNLTAVRDPAAIERRHFLESLAFGRLLAEHAILDGSTRVLDIGAGAGFPGLPLKLAFASLQLSLLESNGKRCDFLRALISELRLDRVLVLEGRAEALGRDPAHRGAYGLVIARAVAPLPVLLEYAVPFLQPGGRLAAAKGSAGPREITDATAALAELGCEIEATYPFQPPVGLEQSLIVVRQLIAVPERYPRRTGIPSKRPLS